MPPADTDQLAALLIAAILLYIGGIGTGLWIGFKLWRQTYATARLIGSTFGIEKDR